MEVKYDSPLPSVARGHCVFALMGSPSHNTGTCGSGLGSPLTQIRGWQRHKNRSREMNPRPHFMSLGASHLNHLTNFACPRPLSEILTA